jgi:hypothetical protein
MPLLLYKGGKPMEIKWKSGLVSVVKAEKECDVYCPICHKVLHLQAGDVIPRCCGKLMEVQK